MISVNKSELLKEFLEYGKLQSVKIIDTHTHMHAVGGASTPVSSEEDCVKLMDDENIESIWCSTHEDLHTSMDEVNLGTQNFMKKYPDRVKGYYVFNPNYKKLYLESLDVVLKNDNFIGVKFLPNYHNHDLDGEGYREVLDFADEHKLIVLSHTWGDKPQNSVENVKNMIGSHKDLFFIMGHSAPGNLDGAIEVAKANENVYLDICDIHRHSGIIEKMVNAVGSERVLFGTDMPWYDPNYAIGSVLFANISDAEKENIFYKNAKKLLERSKR
ncbi:MAG: amidohydrolase family protein [Clostridia bacterium]|nr:amidohydrolase family protein [Clostridia bacterium]